MIFVDSAALLAVYLNPDAAVLTARQHPRSQIPSQNNVCGRPGAVGERVFPGQGVYDKLIVHQKE